MAGDGQWAGWYCLAGLGANFDGRSSLVRIGIVGFGGIAQAHLLGWQASNLPVEIHIHDTAPDRRARAAAVGTVHDDLEDLLAAVDLVDICTPSDSHSQLVKRAVQAGRNVICEKPLALRTEDAIEVVRLARDAGVGLYVGHVVRFFGAYVAAHDAVERGKIGRPAILHFRRAGGQPRSRDWMADEARSGGVVADLMIHDLDQARWMAGEVVRVFAQSAKPGRGGIDTHAYAILTHESGAISHVTASWGLAGGFETSFEIAGSEGIVEYDSRQHPALVADRPELLSDVRSSPPGADSPFAAELRELALSAATGGPSRVSATDAVAAVALVDAVRKSLAGASPVEVPPLPDDLAEALAAGPVGE